MICLMMNKPRGYLTALSDERQATVADLLPEEYKGAGIFPIGRLDKDTEGLLLFTDDGGLCHRLLSPESGISKSYFFVSLGALSEEDRVAIEKGVRIYKNSDFVTAPASVEILSHLKVTEASEYLSGEDQRLLKRRTPATVTVGRVTVSEGKKHQVRRMVGSRGGRVLFLRRISFAGLSLDPGLPLGAVRPLTEDEIALLKTQ